MPWYCDTTNRGPFDLIKSDHKFGLTHLILYDGSSLCTGNVLNIFYHSGLPWGRKREQSIQ